VPVSVQVLVYGDCAVNVNPTSKDLASIAACSADTAAAFGLEPRVAMLSYSTMGSGAGPDVSIHCQKICCCMVSAIRGHAWCFTNEDCMHSGWVAALCYEPRRQSTPEYGCAKSIMPTGWLLVAVNGVAAACRFRR
jgi:hypothetical protein